MLLPSELKLIETKFAFQVLSSIATSNLNTGMSYITNALQSSNSGVKAQIGTEIYCPNLRDPSSTWEITYMAKGSTAGSLFAALKLIICSLPDATSYFYLPPSLSGYQPSTFCPQDLTIELGVVHAFFDNIMVRHKLQM